MPKHRFHVTDIDAKSVELDNQQSEHARRVLRLGIGQNVEVFDGWGNVATGIVSHTGRIVTIDIEEVTHYNPRLPTVDIAVAIPKGNRAENLIEKLVELDANSIIPLITHRSVVEAGSGKFKRFDRIALEASKQCHRHWMLQIYDNTDFADVIEASDHDLKLIADTPDQNSDQTILGYPEQAKSAQKILVLVGPEGGWINEERTAAKNAGFLPWCIGPNVMRIETAAIAATAILKQNSAP